MEAGTRRSHLKGSVYRAGFPSALFWPPASVSWFTYYFDSLCGPKDGSRAWAVGDSYDDARAETVTGLYKLVRWK